jgi:hypothetical protein
MSVLSNVFIYWGAPDWWLWRRGAPCGDSNNDDDDDDDDEYNNNNNNNNNKVILIKITDFIFMTVFPEICWSSHEMIFICKQEIAREGEKGKCGVRGQ